MFQMCVSGDPLVVVVVVVVVGLGEEKVVGVMEERPKAVGRLAGTLTGTWKPARC